MTERQLQAGIYDTLQQSCDLAWKSRLLLKGTVLMAPRSIGTVRVGGKLGARGADLKETLTCLA